MYSTIASCRFWVSKARTDEDATDVEITEAIAKADQKVREDLSKVVDVSLIPNTDPPTCAEYVTFMSEMRAAENILVHIFGGVRKIEEVSDVQYFQYAYKNKLEDVLAGDVDLGDLAFTTGTFEDVSKKDVIPALGHGAYGGFVDEDGLEAIRVEGTERGPERDD